MLIISDIKVNIIYNKKIERENFTPFQIPEMFCVSKQFLYFPLDERRGTPSCWNIQFSPSARAEGSRLRVAGLKEIALLRLSSDS